MTVNLSPVGGAAAQFFDNNGNPLSGGKLYTYAAGTTTPLATYTTVVGDVAHTNPIILDSAGRVPSGQIWLTDSTAYKVTIKTSADVLVGSYDGIIDSGVALVDALRADLVAPGGSALVGYLPAGSGAVATTVQAKLREIISFTGFGAIGNGSTDDSIAITAAIAYLVSIGGGIVDGGGLEYLQNTGNIVINSNNITVRNARFKRTGSATGFMWAWATTADTTGGGMLNCSATGNPLTAGGSGFVTFGSTSYKANKYVLNGIGADSFSQYGVGIGSGDDWVITNITVTNHGLTVGSIASCIGFYLFPRLASSGGKLNNISAQISDACVANVNANTAAVKIQTHQMLVANNIRAVYGSESAISIDSPSGVISNVYVKQQAANAGLSVGNYNPAHAFSGQVFTLDGFFIEVGTAGNNNGFTIAGADGVYSLTGCTIKNGSGTGGIGALNFFSVKDCVFENLSFADIRLSAAYRSFAANSLPSVNNIYRNVTIRGGTVTGVLALETTNSLIVDCGGVQTVGGILSTIDIAGSDNQIIDMTMSSATNNALKVTGDRNTIFDPRLASVTGRSIWFPDGSDDNVVRGSGNLATTGTGILNSGTGNLFYDQTPTTSADSGDAAKIVQWTEGDRTIIYATPISANRAVTLSTTTGVPEGGKIRVVRTAACTGAFNVNVGTGPLKALATAGTWCDVEYDGVAWFLSGYGLL